MGTVESVAVRDFQSIKDTSVELGEFTVLVGPSNSGKALACATEVLTPHGWSTMGTIQPGDEVFHPSGRRTLVVQCSEVMHDRRCYTVTLSDGRKVVADADHLWSVTDQRSAGSPRQTILTTQQMVDIGPISDSGVLRFKVPPTEVIELGKQELPIDPYLLGAWLGDGNSRGAWITTSLVDCGHWVREIHRAGFHPTFRTMQETTCVLGITSPGKGNHERSFPHLLHDLDLIQNKHIPDKYLFASPDQRLALIQGLMDTDGHIGATTGRAEFVSTNRRIAEGFLFLVRSMGWNASMGEYRARFKGKDCGPSYRVGFRPVAGVAPVLLQRKVDRLTPRVRVAGNSIKSIVPSVSVPVRCIKVDEADGMFLAGRDLVPTHNSAFLRATRACLRNSFQPANVRVGSAKSVVTVNLDGAEPVTMERGKSLSTYILGSEKYTKANRTVPEPVSKAIGMPLVEGEDLNFSFQFDRPFLLAETGSRAAQVVGSLTNVTLLHEAVREANRRRQDTSQRLRLRQADVDRYVEQAKEFSDLPQEQKLLAAAEEELARLQAWHYDVTKLRELVGSCREYQDQVDSITIPPEPPALDLEEAGRRLQSLRSLRDLVGRANNHLLGVKQQISLAQSLEAQVQRHEEEYQKVLHELGVCPTCGKPTT